MLRGRRRGRRITHDRIVWVRVVLVRRIMLHWMISVGRRWRRWGMWSIVRCRNSAITGPFGSCVAVTNANSDNSTASNSTAAAAKDDKRYVISRIAGKRAGHWIDAWAQSLAV